jgi:hypothetical protein
MRYRVTCTTYREIVIDAPNEQEAQLIAEDEPFDQWDSLDSEYEIIPLENVPCHDNGQL